MKIVLTLLVAAGAGFIHLSLKEIEYRKKWRR